jgi:hypothetical protein
MAEYRIEREFNNSYNHNYVVHEVGNPAAKWVAKVLMPLQVNFPGLHARAALAYRLAQQLGLRTLDSKTVHLRSFRDFEWPAERSDDWAFITRMQGVNLPTYLQEHTLTDIKNLDTLPEFYAFHLWIGNLDKKPTDYLVDHDRIISIDYHLSGPAYTLDPAVSLGAWAEEYRIHEPDDIGWALEGREDNTPGPLLQHVREVRPQLESFEPMLYKIEAVSDEQIDAAMQGLAFFSYQHVRIDDFYREFLRARRGWLRESIKRWIKLGYPIGARPKTFKK